jgi:hypothetical protein
VRQTGIELALAQRVCHDHDISLAPGRPGSREPGRIEAVEERWYTSAESCASSDDKKCCAATACAMSLAAPAARRRDGLGAERREGASPYVVAMTIADAIRLWLNASPP